MRKIRTCVFDIFGDLSGPICFLEYRMFELMNLAIKFRRLEAENCRIEG